MNATVCNRCNQAREKLYSLPGVPGQYGSECVKVVARENGIQWTSKFGPGAFCVNAMRLAIELNRYENGRWVYPHQARQEQKFYVGSVAWKIAQAMVAKSTAMKLNGSDAQRCYETARRALTA